METNTIVSNYCMYVRVIMMDEFFIIITKKE